MKISFNVTGSERKRLVQTVSDSCGESARYLGMPSMAYEIGPFTVTKDGTLEFSEDVDGSIRTRLYDDLEVAGFSFVRPEPLDRGLDDELAGFGLSVLLPADTLQGGKGSKAFCILFGLGAWQLRRGSRLSEPFARCQDIEGLRRSVFRHVLVLSHGARSFVCLREGPLHTQEIGMQF